MQTQQIGFKFVEETKGAVRYAEILPGGELARYPNSPGARIGVLYIRKTALNGGGIPALIEITIKASASVTKAA